MKYEAVASNEYKRQTEKMKINVKVRFSCSKKSQFPLLLKRITKENTSLICKTKYTLNEKS